MSHQEKPRKCKIETLTKPLMCRKFEKFGKDIIQQNFINKEI
jgi:hypothetical protein